MLDCVTIILYFLLIKQKKLQAKHKHHTLVKQRKVKTRIGKWLILFRIGYQGILGFEEYEI